MEHRRCQATNSQGEPCSASPWGDSDYCLWHDRSPEAEARRRENARRGGQGRSARARAAKLIADEGLTLREVQGVMNKVLKDLLAGKLDSRTAVAAATVSRAIGAIAQAGDLEERVKALEERTGEKVA